MTGRKEHGELGRQIPNHEGGGHARLRVPLRLAALARAALITHPQVEDRGGPIVR